MDIQVIIFWALSALTLVSAAVVAFSRNIIHSAFSLLGVFTGILGLYILLSADFVAVVQLVVYIGGILVLIIFAVMMTVRVDKENNKRILLNRVMEPISAGMMALALLGVVLQAVYFSLFATRVVQYYVPTTAAIGNKLLGEYLLPFEAVSVLLVLVLVGAVYIGRERS